jgi:hypothetical protein
MQFSFNSSTTPSFQNAGAFNLGSSASNIFGQPIAQQQQHSSSLFGQPVAQQQHSSSLFGQPAPQQQNLFSFGQPVQQQQSSGLFGQPAPQQQSSGLFGQPAPQQQSSGLFGQPASQQQSSGLFGQPAPQQKQQADAQSNLFWGSSPNIFTGQVNNGPFGTSTTSNMFIDNAQLEKQRIETMTATKKIIHDFMFPFPPKPYAKGVMFVRAKRVIRQYQSSEEDIVDLMMHYIESGTWYADYYRVDDENIYDDLEEMFQLVLEKLRASSFADKFIQRVRNFVANNKSMGHNYGNTISEMLRYYFN